MYVCGDVFQWAGNIIAGGEFETIFGDFICVFVSSDAGVARDPEEFDVFGLIRVFDDAVDHGVCGRVFGSDCV